MTDPKHSEPARYCPCADPENCTEQVPGYVCRKSAHARLAGNGDTASCDHSWIANSGRGGEPDFRLNRTMSDKPLMHVICSQCNDRTWLTKEQWDALEER